MKVRLIIKATVLVLVLFAYNAAMNFVSPIIANELAMLQMNNSADSNLCIQLYTYLLNYEKVAFAIFIVVLFSREVQEIIKMLEEKRNEGEN